MIRKNLIFMLLAFFFTLTACENDPVGISELISMPSDKYYDSEIIEEEELGIYGRWTLESVSGGFHGMGHEKNFDYLVLKPIGIYGFIRNDTLLEYGRIVIQEQDEERLLINLEADPASDHFFFDPEKYVDYSGGNDLNLNSPCCDRYNYHFLRSE